MKKACLVVQEVYQNNEIFKPDSPLNRDNCLEFFHELKKQFLNSRIDLQTQDLCSQEEAEFIIFNEVPKNLSEVKYPQKATVLLFESELIHPDNWKNKNHESFKYIFTWNDDYVDNKKYFKFNFTGPHPIDFKQFSEKKKFCTLVAGNKYVSHPLELYSKRIEAIRWFEKHHPEQFEFYGLGWGTHAFKFRFQIISKVLNRIKPLASLLAEQWPSCRGPVKDKLQMMQNFKFSICYENAQGIYGYITEKIFDSLGAGCIPIYWGAPNITQFVPKECFISKTDYKSYEELFQYLSSMTEIEYNNRLQAIKNYLSSDRYKLFQPSHNAKVVVERLTHA